MFCIVNGDDNSLSSSQMNQILSVTEKQSIRLFMIIFQHNPTISHPHLTHKTLSLSRAVALSHSLSGEKGVAAWDGRIRAMCYTRRHNMHASEAATHKQKEEKNTTIVCVCALSK